MKDTPIDRQKFYKAILTAYADGVEMTARECAVKLFHKGIVYYPTRGAVQPRLTEMCKLGWMKTVGSKYDNTTHKTVTIYAKKEAK